MPPGFSQAAALFSGSALGASFTCLPIMGSPRLVVFYPRRFLFPDKVSHPLFTRFLRRDRETDCLLRGSGLRENETEATRCGDAEPETRVSIASPAVNHSTSKGHPTLEGRGHGLPLRAEGETVTFPKGVRTGQDLGDRLCEQDSREPQTYVPGTTPSTPGVGVGDARALPMPSASSKDRLHPSQRQG